MIPKHCPVCGGNAVVEVCSRRIVLAHSSSGYSAVVHIRCPQCGASNISFASENTACMWWNRRK